MAAPSSGSKKTVPAVPAAKRPSRIAWKPSSSTASTGQPSSTVRAYAGCTNLVTASPAAPRSSSRSRSSAPPAAWKGACRSQPKLEAAEVSARALSAPATSVPPPLPLPGAKAEVGSPVSRCCSSVVTTLGVGAGSAPSAEP
eukprot:scaffold27882_cov61-Phaeocystis_antarctica.AAC.5